MSSTQQSNNAALIEAVQVGDHYRVEQLIITGADVNVKDTDGKPVVLMAAQNGQTECLKLLLHAEADPNNFDKDRKTALMHAAESGAESCVNVLIQAGADVNASTPEGYTALMFAAMNGHDKSVDFILKGGANVNMTDYIFRTALMHAASQSNHKCTKLLTEAGADVNKVDHIERTAFIYAAKKGQHKSIHVLLQAGADMNRPDCLRRSPLVYSAWYGHDKCTDMLIKASCHQSLYTPRNDYVKALVYSAWFGHDTCMNLLIKAGVDVNKASDNLGTALYRAIKHEHYKCAIELVKAGAGGDDPRLLRHAVSKGLEDLAKGLIQVGADVNSISHKGTTVLFEAAESCHIECAKVLILAGVRVNIINFYGDNALTNHIKHCKSMNERLALLLFSAGEFLDDTTIRIIYSKQNLSPDIKEILAPSDVNMDLHSICRVAIRMHLLNMDPYQNLFHRICQLGLPTILTDYLLFGVSVDVNKE